MKFWTSRNVVYKNRNHEKEVQELFNLVKKKKPIEDFLLVQEFENGINEINDDALNDADTSEIETVWEEKQELSYDVQTVSQ